MASFLPGFYSIVFGERNPEVALQLLNAHNSYLRNLCNEILYSEPDYNMAFDRFYSKLKPVLDARDNQHPRLIPRKHLASVLTYFYNRQFMVQLMRQPDKFPGTNIHIPIDRAPSKQLIVDILALMYDQRKVNYNLRYLVVIMDPFSRFVWAHPVARLTSGQVKKAFFLAFDRPGISQQFYHHLRDKITEIVVDGGSEFKDTFPTNLHFAFPHATLITSQPKSKTGGRPTNTGPVEAAIGMIRRVLRKYEWTQDRNFLRDRQGGLTQVLNMINNATSQPLHHKTPTYIVESILENNVNNIQEAQTYMDNAQTKKIQKKKAAIARIGGGPGGEFWVVTDPHGSFAYRLYLPPPPFSKLVTVKVSQELYIIRRQNVGYKGMQLELQIYGEEGNNHEIGKLVNWQQLVLVRAPVDMGPPQIRDLLLQQVRNMQYQQFTPREVTQAFAIPPEIRAAIGREAPALVAQLDNQAIDGNPIDRNRRQNVARPGRYRN